MQRANTQHFRGVAGMDGCAVPYNVLAKYNVTANEISGEKCANSRRLYVEVSFVPPTTLFWKQTQLVWGFALVHYIFYGGGLCIAVASSRDP